MSTPSIVASNARIRWYNSAPVRIVALVLTLTTAAACELLHLNALADSDIWWHLSTGSWILQNHAIPRTALLSQYPSLPWVDSSWGFDVLTALCYRIWGLVGLPFPLMLLQVAIAIAIFVLAGGRRNFWPAVILSALAQYSIAPVSPHPAMCSLVLLACELTLLLRARRTGDTRSLFWLPLVFVIWVNLDRQFSYGLLALALFWIAVTVEQVCRRQGITWFDTELPVIPIATTSTAVGASLLATIISPYGYRSYLPVWLSATNSAADRFLPEFHSMRFRRPQDYVLMLLAMTAFFALGRRRSRDLFLISLLSISAIISFRYQRDNWLVLVAGIAIIGNAITIGQSTVVEPTRKLHIESLATAAVIVIALLVPTFSLPWNDRRYNEALLSKIAQTFPIGAADYIRANHLPPPLFNPYAWGGFLTWALPEYPVLIDGRTDLYGDALNLPYLQAIMAEIPLQSYVGFTQAQTILLEPNSPMAQALSALPGFRVAYKDGVAVVLVRTD